MNRRSHNRPLKRRLFILCEGTKTEPNYLKEIVNALSFRGKPIEICETDITDPFGLVGEACKIDKIGSDEVWVVFDKNGHSNHKDAYKEAKNKDIKIAFSSISFEIWILLHFEFTKNAFKNSQQLIDYIKKKYLSNYKKNLDNLYAQTKNSLNKAKANAIKVRKYQDRANPRGREYTRNPWTNFDQLINAINVIHNEYQ